MSYSVLIEPADEHRQAFAKWCLSRTPRLETATAFGTEVSSELFKQIPEELLVGAYIDGRLYRHVVESHVVEEEAAPAAPVKTSNRRRKASEDTD